MFTSATIPDQAAIALSPSGACRAVALRRLVPARHLTLFPQGKPNETSNLRVMKMGQTLGRLSRCDAYDAGSGRLPSGKSCLRHLDEYVIRDWFVPSNWDAGVPDSSTGVIINTGGTALIGTPGATCKLYLAGTLCGPLHPRRKWHPVAKCNLRHAGTLTTGEISVGRVQFDQPPSSLQGFFDHYCRSGRAFYKRSAEHGLWRLDRRQPVGGRSRRRNGGRHRCRLAPGCAGRPDCPGVGNSSGTFIVENGGRAQSPGGSVTIGTATVKGNGSLWQSSGILSVGIGSANSSLNILSGGLVTTPTMTLYNGLVVVDNGSSTTSGLTISGIRAPPAAVFRAVSPQATLGLAGWRFARAAPC